MASALDTTLQIIGKPTFCIDNGDSAILRVSPATTIQWYKNGFIINGAQQPALRINSSGTYYAVLTNDDGCKLSTNRQPIVIDKAKQGITYPVSYALLNTPFTLNARQIGETVRWSPGTYLNNVTSLSPVFTGATERLYTINIRTATECITVDTQLVKIIKAVEMFVPTAFTPNNDNRNDFLRPILRGIKELRYFRVFNRWGNVLYESRKEQPGWDGLYKGAVQQTQTVIWMVEGVGLDDKIYFQKGTSVLLK